MKPTSAILIAALSGCNNDSPPEFDPDVISTEVGEDYTRCNPELSPDLMGASRPDASVLSVFVEFPSSKKHLTTDHDWWSNDLEKAHACGLIRLAQNTEVPLEDLMSLYGEAFRKVTLGLYISDGDTEPSGGALSDSFYVSGSFEDLPKATFHEMTHLAFSDVRGHSPSRVFVEGSTELISRTALPANLYSESDPAYPGYTLLAAVVGGEDFIPRLFQEDSTREAFYASTADKAAPTLCPFSLRDELARFIDTLPIDPSRQEDALFGLEPVYCVDYGTSEQSFFPDHEFDQDFRVHLLQEWATAYDLDLETLFETAAPIPEMASEWSSYANVIRSLDWYTPS